MLGKAAQRLGTAYKLFSLPALINRALTIRFAHWSPPPNKTVRLSRQSRFGPTKRIKRNNVAYEPHCVTVWRNIEGDVRGSPSLFALALIAPESRHAHWRSQLPGFGLLLACYRERAIKIYFCPFSGSGANDLSATSPAARCTSASHHFSFDLGNPPASFPRRFPDNVQFGPNSRSQNPGMGSKIWK